jgi:hypothetical protein
MYDMTSYMYNLNNYKILLIVKRYNVESTPLCKWNSPKSVIASKRSKFRNTLSHVYTPCFNRVEISTWFCTLLQAWHILNKTRTGGKDTIVSHSPRSRLLAADSTSNTLTWFESGETAGAFVITNHYTSGTFLHKTFLRTQRNLYSGVMQLISVCNDTYY